MSETLLIQLVDLTVRACVLLAVGWLVATVMRRRSAAERHSVWLFALVGLLVMPLMLAIAPRIGLSIPGASAIDAVATIIEQELVGQSSAFPNEASLAEGVSAAASDDAAAPFTQDPIRAPGVLRPATVVVAVYALVALLFALRYAGMRVRVARHLRSLSRVEDAALLRQLDDVRAMFGIRRKVTLLYSEHDRSPWAWGSVRPQLVVPAGFPSWSRERQQCALLHELSHVARNDHLSGMFAQLTCVLHWFNPLVWFAVRRLLLEAEKSCDDRVISSGGCASTYAEQLLEIAGQVFASKGRSVWVPAMAHRSSLTPRVRSILNPNNRRSAMSKSRISVFAAAAFAVFVPLATLHSQQPVLDLNDPEFQVLVGKGPNGSAELERIVDTYVANDMTDEAADAAARFVMGEFGTPDEHGCNFCIEVFSSEAMPHEHRHLQVVVDAFALIEERADADASGDLLLQATLSNIAASGNTRAMSRATYLVVRALTIGVDELNGLAIAEFLYDRGNLKAASDLANWLYHSESSAHYQSEDAKAWVTFFESETRRFDAVETMILEQLGMNEAVSDLEYLPVFKVPPVYPAAAAESRLEGSVVVEFTVNALGKPEDVTVVTSTNSIFNESALAAAREFRYTPRVISGAPVSVPGVRNKITYALAN